MHAAVRAAVAEMILSHAKWDLWITFTFNDLVSPEMANAILKKWARRIAKNFDAHFKLAYVRENQSGGFPHFHVLVALPPGDHSNLRLDWFVEEWRAASPRSGFAKVALFDPARAEACASYMTKDGEVEFQVACPRALPCRRTGCLQAPGPWHNGSF
jgi:hypothetical protein